MGTCRYCNQSAGFLRKQHPHCRDLHSAGIQEMTQLAAQATGTSDFNESALRQTLQATATRAWATEDDISQAIADGWAQGVSHALSHGVLTREEETQMRDFRDRLALEEHPALREAFGKLLQGARDRLLREARQTALNTWDGEAALTRLARSVSNADLDHFGLSAPEVNANGAHTSLVQAAVIREVTQGIIPQRQKVNGPIPFNLMKPKQLVWVIDGVDYLERVTRRERRGTSHGVRIRVAKGLYYRPSTFRSRAVEWEETVHADTGLLGLTTKHTYFTGTRKKFRVRYDRIMSFEPYENRFGIMRDAQKAKLPVSATARPTADPQPGIQPCPNAFTSSAHLKHTGFAARD